MVCLPLLHARHCCTPLHDCMLSIQNDCMMEKEMVRPPSLHAMAGLHALNHRCLSEGEASEAWQHLCLTVVLSLPAL